MAMCEAAIDCPLCRVELSDEDEVACDNQENDVMVKANRRYLC